MDNFADHPKTIGEIKSDKTDSAHDWTAREALIYLLREIDKGALDITNVIVTYDTDTTASYCVAGKAPILYKIGLLESVKIRLVNKSCHYA